MKKMILVNGVVLEVNPTETGIQVILNGEHLCRMEANFAIWDMASYGLQKWLSHLWDSFAGIAYYHSGNLPLLKEIGAFIEPSERAALGLPPRYWRAMDRESTNWNRSRNGGDYSFWRNFHPTPEGYEVSYRSSTDLDYCPSCGQFHEQCGAALEMVDQLPEGAYPVY